MPHLADYLPHNRKAASRIHGALNTPGTCFATSLTARIVRLTKEGRAIQSQSTGSFYAAVEKACAANVISVKQIAVLVAMQGVINNWFQSVSDKVYVTITKDKTRVKELIWAELRLVEKSFDEPIGFKLILKKRLTWMEGSGKFVDTTSH